ncbi:MAG: hypothetical protein ACI9BF_000391 [Candidatus Paceibacteria bacterium]|jgi:hypothetical protein
MTKTISFKAVTTAGLVLFFLGTIAIAQANHSWGKYHWDLSTAETEASPLKLGNNLTTAAWQASLASTSVDWNQTVLKNKVVAGTSDSACSPTLGQVEICNGAYGSTGWLGIAQVWAYRGKDAHIAQGVVQLNDTYFNTSPYTSAAWRNMVMCQEVGHTFGLDHQDENFSNENKGTCMDYTNDPSGLLGTNGVLNNERPNQHDKDMMTDIYSHLNSTDGGGGGGKPGGGKKGKPSNVGAGIDLNNPSAWGEAVQQDAQGKDSVFVRNLGNGTELITHVLWAPEQE